ncbi:hypothetical protein QM480_24365 [Flectobacillus sp. DC10W]|uniref:Lipoprotein n=1 Tax=Flectobacillus longus TaxID=2984207 RepID=A0ABT6YVA6_9BACT|nr:hypothetical protein [Flectobacillus longus]MDI9867501.1 hypothetical protein [Flectobacillus longus]
MKKSIYLLYSISVFILGLITGCTPTKVFNLEPFGATNSTVINGRTVVKESKDSVDIVASFVGLYHDYAVFDIEVFNRTNHDLLVAPKDFMLKPFNEDKTPYFYQNQEYVGYLAIDPTEEIIKLDNRMVKEEKRIKTAKTVNTILAIAGAVTLIAGATKSSGYRETASARNTMALGETMLRFGLTKGAVDRSLYYSRMDQYASEKDVWQHQTFLKNVISPNSSLRGDVFIRYTAAAPLMQISFPTQSDDIVIWFEKGK